MEEPMRVSNRNAKSPPPKQTNKQFLYKNIGMDSVYVDIDCIANSFSSYHQRFAFSPDLLG